MSAAFMVLNINGKGSYAGGHRQAAADPGVSRAPKRSLTPGHGPGVNPPGNSIRMTQVLRAHVCPHAVNVAAGQRRRVETTAPAETRSLTPTLIDATGGLGLRLPHERAEVSA